MWASFGYTTVQKGDQSHGGRRVAAGRRRRALCHRCRLLPRCALGADYIKRCVSPTYANGFRVAGAKLTIDGSPQGFTAWRDRPYYEPIGDFPPGYSG